MANPFTITFGRKPEEMIERFPQKNEILDSFTAENANQQIYIITGIRGCGKTVLMTEIAERLRREKDWITVELNPEADLLKGLAAKLYSHPVCQPWFERMKLNLSFLGLGAEIAGTPPITDLETAISRMLETVKKRRKRLLITIDEATNSKPMRVFAAAFQIFVRQNLPLFLLMTGLHENIYELQSEKSLTFLYRAPKIPLPLLDLSAIRNRYESLFHTDRSTATEMAVLTGGYPFAFQLLGYLTWNREGNYRAVLEEYRQYLYEYVYNKIWEELSPKDRRFLTVMSGKKEKTAAEIKEALGVKDSEFSPYRQRLIRKGIVDGSTRGILRLTLPLFDQFVQDKLEFQ